MYFHQGDTISTLTLVTRAPGVFYSLISVSRGFYSKIEPILLLKESFYLFIYLFL